VKYTPHEDTLEGDDGKVLSAFELAKGLFNPHEDTLEGDDGKVLSAFELAKGLFDPPAGWRNQYADMSGASLSIESLFASMTEMMTAPAMGPSVCIMSKTEHDKMARVMRWIEERRHAKWYRPRRRDDDIREERGMPTGLPSTTTPWPAVRLRSRRAQVRVVRPRITVESTPYGEDDHYFFDKWSEATR
jgi:hypothetical protein